MLLSESCTFNDFGIKNGLSLRVEILQKDYVRGTVTAWVVGLDLENFPSIKEFLRVA